MPGSKVWTAELRLLFETTADRQPCQPAQLRRCEELPESQLWVLEKVTSTTVNGNECPELGQPHVRGGTLQPL